MLICSSPLGVWRPQMSDNWMMEYSEGKGNAFFKISFDPKQKGCFQMPVQCQAVGCGCRSPSL